MGENYDSFFDPSKNYTDDRTETFLIEHEPILQEYAAKDIKEFVYDLFLVFHILRGINVSYSDYANSLDHDLETFKNLVQEWNKKYRDIMIDFKEKDYEYVVDVYFDVLGFDDVKKIISKMSRFIGINEKNDNLEAEFDSTDEGINTISLRKGEQVKLIYLEADMLRPNSPEFRLCTYFAMKNGYDRDIDLQSFSEKFSFEMQTDEKGEGGWHKRYPSIRFTSSDWTGFSG